MSRLCALASQQLSLGASLHVGHCASETRPPNNECQALKPPRMVAHVLPGLSAGQPMPSLHMGADSTPTSWHCVRRHIAGGRLGSLPCNVSQAADEGAVAVEAAAVDQQSLQMRTPRDQHCLPPGNHATTHNSRGKQANGMKTKSLLWVYLARSQAMVTAAC